MKSGKVDGKSRHRETSYEATSVFPARDDGGLDYRGCRKQERIATIEEIFKR